MKMMISRAPKFRYRSPPLHSQSLVWSAVAISILICIAISFLHFEQRNTLNQAIISLDTIRQARVDLAEGFLQISLSGNSDLPFDRHQGQALVFQAMAQIKEHAHWLDRNGETFTTYQHNENLFRAQLESWSKSKAPSPSETTALLISFHNLAQQANVVDAESRAGLLQLATRIDITFSVFISLAAILLTGICTTVFAVQQAQARAEHKRAKAEYDLSLLNSELEQRVADRTAELEQANQAKNAFLARMSHELRTPLNAIIGFTGTLLMKLPGPLTADQQRHLSIIQRSAHHLLALISDILDLAKIESGRVVLSLEPITCQAVIEEVLSHLRPLAEQKELNLTLVVPDQPIMIYTDRRALNQILINLVSNAIKFTNEGSVLINLNDQKVGDQHQTMIQVVDTGIGIHDSDLPQLFKEFGRVNSADVREREGTGLGLRLSQQLAMLLGGRIEVESSFGIGSTFTLVLPDEDLYRSS
ncbi:MAG: hypothetical protein HGA19_11225 [Oscillochloris sp.]|nr:hypothetical protein [Oscillochloris sp.]